MNRPILYTTIKAEMARKNMRFQDMSKMLKIAYPTVGKKLRGDIQWKIREINALCEYFNKSYEELFKEG